MQNCPVLVSQETAESNLFRGSGADSTVNSRGPGRARGPLHKCIKCLCWLSVLWFATLCIPHPQAQVTRENKHSALEPLTFRSKSSRQQVWANDEVQFLCPTKNAYLLQSVCTNANHNLPTLQANGGKFRRRLATRNRSQSNGKVSECKSGEFYLGEPLRAKNYGELITHYDLALTLTLNCPQRSERNRMATSPEAAVFPIPPGQLLRQVETT